MKNCPKCGAEKEYTVNANTMFMCGSIEYNGKNFHQSKQCLTAELAILKDKLNVAESHLDLMVDEFQRIKALQPSSEIVALCERAIEQTCQRVPLIVQRDKAVKVLGDAAELIGEVREFLDGLFDGSPDASPLSKQANSLDRAAKQFLDENPELKGGNEG